MTGWNPWYLAYCRAHGHTPEAQLAADAVRYPGGSMVPFKLWMTARWSEFGRPPAITDDDQARFGAWLLSCYPEQLTLLEEAS